MRKPAVSSAGRAATKTAAHPPFIVHCLELLGPMGQAQARGMFGGHGLYLDGLMVALVAGDQLYMKVDAQTLPHWQAAGGRPFTYETKRAGQPRREVMSYWTPPDAAMESRALMRPWARLALEAALRTRAAKKPSAPRRAAKKKAG
jgi:DNA transformation protein